MGNKNSNSGRRSNAVDLIQSSSRFPNEETGNILYDNESDDQAAYHHALIQSSTSVPSEETGNISYDNENDDQAAYDHEPYSVSGEETESITNNNDNGGQAADGRDVDEPSRAANSETEETKNKDVLLFLSDMLEKKGMGEGFDFVWEQWEVEGFGWIIKLLIWCLR